MKSAEIRERFCAYFEKQGHTRVASGPLVPADDPTLYFTNAGMVPFKRVFTGEDKRDYRRAVSSQKCLRVSGKHNDLEVVGRTPRHHTFFEMLGNFSFGDYFKREAIFFGWDFLTREMGIPKAPLWVTVFEKDDEAAGLWAKEAKVPKDRILKCGEATNFWSMGPTGPCGPCAEIHYDLGPKFGCGKKTCAVNCECGRFLEIWNLVFMQYDRGADGKLAPLPKPSIDTGMGLERLAAILQKKNSNYETDLFVPILHEIEAVIGSTYGKDGDRDVSIRVVADHLRATSFLIADGIVPSNEGRGYVLRRILRRAIRHGKLLGQEEPFLHRLVAPFAELMGGAYPELSREAERVAQAVQSEEEKFLETLEAGTKLLTAEIASLKKQKIKSVPGTMAFKLYDTFGFPLDLTELISEEKGLKVDTAGFDTAMAEQKKQARAAWKGSGAKGAGSVYADIYGKGIRTEFTGYAALAGESEVAGLLQGGVPTAEVRAGEEAEIITPTTPFYGESGGQVGDRGIISSGAFELRVLDTLKPYPDLHVHQVKVVNGAVREGALVNLSVDPGFRIPVMLNHSATHLAHAAIRKLLGNHVKQAGSLVDDRRLRFDFSHFKGAAPEELKQIEDLVNEKIRANLEVSHKVMGYQEALASGALAFFGDKYGDRVRVCRMGDFSVELCGGTHVRRTGEIGFFKFISEGSVASGVRRVEAVTGAGAHHYIRGLEASLEEVARGLKTSPKEVAARVQKLLDQVKSLEKEIEGSRRQTIAAPGVEEIHEIGGVNLLLYNSSQTDARALREVSDRLIQKIGSGIVILAGVADGKSSLIVRVTQDLTGRFKAGELVKELAVLIGGSGGGRPDMAQAGGSREIRPQELISRLQQLLA